MYVHRQSVQRTDSGQMTDTWRMKMSQRAMSIDNISFLSPPMSRPLQYESEKDFGSSDLRDAEEYSRDTAASYADNEPTKYNDDGEDDENNIIPWKKLLRKTNSRLNLIT